MDFLIYVAYFFGGGFFVNAIPHLVKGVTGSKFQTPFAKPPGVGLSRSLQNVIWAWINLLIGYLLVFQVRVFDPRMPFQILAFGLGGFLMSIYLARYFGKFHGGN